MAQDTITTTEVVIDEEIRKELFSNIDEEKQIIVNCIINGGNDGTAARIWKSTYLVDNVSKQRSVLLHTIGVSHYPNWTRIPPKSTLRFSLIFSALPQSTKVFDLVEQIPESGGFYFSGLRRNDADVYQVDLTD
jgi:hypothetical protein